MYTDLSVERAAILIGRAALRADRRGQESIVMPDCIFGALVNDDLTWDEAHSYSAMLACVMYVQELYE